MFLGCTIPARAMEYELSARNVLKQLGVETLDLDFGCCGFPLEAVNEEKALAMAAANLAMAENQGLDVLTLCSACSEMLSRANIALKDEKTLIRVNEFLSERVGFEYRGVAKVTHLARMLHYEYGVDKLKESVVYPLRGLKIAVHYGCHYMRPSTVYGEQEDPQYPHSLDRLVELTGAESIEHENKMTCCGGALLNIDEQVAVDMTKMKLEPLSRRSADALLVICPYCGIMYGRYQHSILEEGREIPVIYYPQLLGLAMGLKPDELGFQFNVPNAQAFLAKVGF